MKYLSFINTLIGRLGGKKFVITAVGLIFMLMKKQIDPAQLAALADHGEVLVKTGYNEIVAIIAIIGSFNIGQGIADGLTKGATSSVAAVKAEDAK